MMRILVVEDDRKVASFMERGLREEGYAVDVAHDGADGSLKAHGGTVAAANREGGGAIFTVTLPAVPSAAPRPRPAPGVVAGHPA